MKLEGAIFDLDGTLVDSMYIWDRAPGELVRYFGGNPPDDLAYTIREMDRWEAAEYCIRTFQLSDTPEALLDRLNELVSAEYRDWVPMKPGADVLLARLAAAGIPCAVATASEAFQARDALDRLGLWKYFRCALSCVQYGPKSGPGIYFEAARRLVAAPERCVVFEDALHAAQTAKAAGFLVAGVYDSSAGEDQKALRDLCDFYLPRLDNYSGLEQFL